MNIFGIYFKSKFYQNILQKRTKLHHLNFFFVEHAPKPPSRSTRRMPLCGTPSLTKKKITFYAQKVCHTKAN